jgi:hypothetical protein
MTSPLLDAQGNPVSTRELTDAQIVSAFEQLSLRDQALTQQVTQLGLFIEFLYEQVGTAQNEDGSPVIPISMDDFPAWAQNRVEELQAQMTALSEDPGAAAAVNLDEESVDG